MIDIPILTTDRLILRPPTMDDYPAYAAFLASPRAQYMGGPLQGFAAWGMFCHDIACWSLFGHGALMIDLRSTGQCVGQVGINHGPLFPEKELGWLLFAGFEGRGYAQEGAGALRNWAFAELGLATLVSYVDSHNTASIAVAERLGARRDDQALRQDPEDMVFRHGYLG
jgi:RimJ/RimL family protein N-acetyltransferase